jgi:hypothetical protein
MKRFVLFFILLVFFFEVPAQPFTPGNIVVVRIGDGIINPLTNAATPIFLDEYTTTGTLVTSTALPVVTSGGNRRFSQSGTATTEGYLSLSEIGNYLVLGGYDEAIGTAGVSTSTVDGVIAKVDKNRLVNTANTFLRTSTNAYTAANFRSVTSKTGQQFWTSGDGTSTTGGIFYYLEGTGMIGQLSNTIFNTRAARIFDEKLYVSANSGTIRLGQLGATGPPTTPGQTITNLTGLPTATHDPMEFFLLDADPNVTGNDLLYFASLTTNPGIYKYSFDGTTWTARGSLTSPCQGLTARFNCSGGVDLFITKATIGKPTQLFKFTDNAAYNATITSNGMALSNGVVGTLLVTAPTNTAFGGVAFSPSDGVYVAFGTSQNIPAGNYNTIYIDNTATATLTGDITVYDKIVVKSGGTLVTNNFTISSPAGIGSIFELRSGGLLKIGSDYGITLSTTGITGGNIQTCIRRYSNGAGYEYNGTVPQYSGNGLPTVPQMITGKLVINNSALGTDGVTLTQNTQVTGELVLTLGKLTTTSTTIIQLGSSSILTTLLSDASFVNGPIQKYGNTSFIFPVGKGVTIHPIGFVMTGGGNPGDLLIAEYFHSGTTCSPQSYGPGIHHTSGLEYWTLVRATMAAASSQITLYATTYSSATDKSKLVVAKCVPGTGWANLGNADLVTLGSTGPVTSSTSVTGNIPSFPTPTVFTLASIVPASVNPLPIDLISFDATKLSNTKSSLDWELAACCSSAAKFEVQRAGANKNFTTIATIGGSETNRLYTYVDNGLQTGINYYRLRMKDVNNVITYSRIVAVMNGVNGLLLTSLIPTVTTHTAVLTVSSSKEQKLDLLITDMQGKAVRKLSYSMQSGNTSIVLPVAGLAAGIYQLTGIYAEGKTNTIRFIRQ